MITTSVIIPTVNRPKPLEDMLKSLLEQSVLPDEFIIVDQSISNESKQTVHALFSKLNGLSRRNIILKYIHDPTITGASQARNRGIGATENDIIFFFDDDVILEKDYIEEALRVYKQYPEVVGVGGVITNYSFLNKPRIRLFNNIFFKGLFNDERKEIFSNFIKYTKPVIASKLSGGCSSYKKSILLKEDFDEIFDKMFDRYSFGEDIDLSMRISKNHKLMITPYAKMKHIINESAEKRKHNNLVIYFEVASWTYIFNAHMDRKIFNFICYLWAYLGLFFRTLKGLLFLNFLPLKSLVLGTKKGLYFSKNKDKNFSFSSHTNIVK